MSREIQTGFDLRTTAKSEPAFSARRGYKFFQQKFADYYFRKGSIRIGTLSEFREHENKDLSDIYEGSRSAFIPGDRAYNALEVGVGVPDSVMSRFFSMKDEEAGKTVKLRGGEFVAQLPDYHVFCFSRRCDTTTAATFPGYDMVARITDVFRLGKFVVENFPDFADYAFYVGQVTYVDRAKSALLPPQSEAQAVLEKPIVFTGNVEARIVFVPPMEKMTGKAEPKFFTHPSLCGFFRPHEYPGSTAAPLESL